MARINGDAGAEDRLDGSELHEFGLAAFPRQHQTRAMAGRKPDRCIPDDVDTGGAALAAGGSATRRVYRIFRRYAPNFSRSRRRMGFSPVRASSSEIAKIRTSVRKRARTDSGS